MREKMSDAVCNSEKYKEFLQRILQFIENEPNVKLDMVEFRPGCDAGDNYMSCVRRVTITGHTSNHHCIKLIKNTSVNMLLLLMMLFIHESEDSLQKNIYEFQTAAEEYDLKISIAKTKILDFQGKHPVQSKIVLNDSVLEQFVRRSPYIGATGEGIYSEWIIPAFHCWPILINPVEDEMLEDQWQDEDMRPEQENP